MGLSILNNISAMTAENNLDATQTSLQNTLTQLSSGSRINSGSDDPAGLSIINGLTANIAALTQSEQNATNGTGVLQTADGALSEVTTLLNQAVTLATEASTSGMTSDQMTALNNEFTSIQNEITNIGKTTTFNGSAVFGTSTDSNTVQSNDEALTGGTTLNSGSVAVKVGSDSYNFTVSSGGETVTNFHCRHQRSDGHYGDPGQFDQWRTTATERHVAAWQHRSHFFDLELRSSQQRRDIGSRYHWFGQCGFAKRRNRRQRGCYHQDRHQRRRPVELLQRWASTTYDQLVTAINNANIGVTAAISGGGSINGTFSLTDTENRGDIAVTSSGTDAANALNNLSGNTAAAPMISFRPPIRPPRSRNSRTQR